MQICTSVVGTQDASFIDDSFRLVQIRTSVVGASPNYLEEMCFRLVQIRTSVVAPIGTYKVIEEF